MALSLHEYVINLLYLQVMSKQVPRVRIKVGDQVFEHSKNSGSNQAFVRDSSSDDEDNVPIANLFTIKKSWPFVHK